MRNFLIIALLTVLVSSLSYGQNKGSRKGLAVLEFTEQGEVSKDTGLTIADYITNKIDPEQYFIVERSQLSKVLKERIHSEVITGKEKESLRMLGVNFVMLGNISKIENEYYGGYRIVNVDIGR